jgi:alpha-glucoside transport system permease protein
MQKTTPSSPKPQIGVFGQLGASIGRILVSILIPLIAFIVLYQGFLFLRDSDAPKLVVAGVAIVWGVGGVLLLYFMANWIVEKMPEAWRQRIQPYVFVGPAIAILLWYLAIPALRTIYLSFFDRNSQQFVGLQNYVTAFTERFMLEAFRNNLLWIIVGATASVLLGLIIAVLADRSRFETFAKTMIFLPMAISMVGAGIIWNFMYAVRDPASPQIGLLNAILSGLGAKPLAWTALIQPWNNLFLIVVVVWMQTGFAMVLFSAAIKGISADLLEAARVDGANEWRVFFSIMIPSIQGTIITVSTTIIIFTLKIFDVVMVMTGGQYGTDVIATQFYRQYFTNRNFGLGSAIAVVLLIAVIPVMIYNLRQFRESEAFK